MFGATAWTAVGGFPGGCRLPRFYARGHKSHRHDIPRNHPQVVAWYVVGRLGLVNGSWSKQEQAKKKHQPHPITKKKKPNQHHRNRQPNNNNNNNKKKKKKKKKKKNKKKKKIKSFIIFIL